MRSNRVVLYGLILAFVLSGAGGLVGFAGQAPQNPAQQATQNPTAPAEATIRLPPPDPTIATLVTRLDFDQYKATIKGLTQFGDRRQGTKRNRDAVDWIETQLKSYGCTNTERITYTYTTPQRNTGAGNRGGGGQRSAPPAQGEPVRTGPGGSTEFGDRAQTGVASFPPREAGAGTSTDPVGRLPQAPIDARHQALNAEPSVDGERQEVYCTKIGKVHPDEMYIVGGHMDGIGWGEAANDDGSGAALVMQVARIFSSPDVETARSIRFILWNNEESGLNGSRAYVAQRKDLQGKEDPPGSGKYPEPKWLGMIQHDMMLWDHGMPQPLLDASGQAIKDAEGRVIYHAPKDQRPEADVNIEFQSMSTMSEASQKLAWALRFANDRYATDYPAEVGPHMTNTDSAPFQDLVASVSLRENERGSQIQAGWDPNWHQPTDVFTTYSDKDFRLGLNAAQTTLAAIAQLTGATIKK